MIQSANRLFLAMKVGANSTDEKFLDALAEKFKGEHLPKATAKGNEIYLQGLEKPLKVEDLSKGLFSYNGKSIDVNMKNGVEQGLDDLSKIIFPKSVGLWGWILPQAYASSDPMILLASLAGVGGLALAANSCGEGPNNSVVGCGMGGLMGGFGLGYLISSLLNDNSPTPPQNMTCSSGQNGCKQVVLMGQNRVPVNTISQCPGQNYSYSPALSQVPPAQGQYMASQLSQMCPYPGMMTNINTAYAAPTYFAAQPPVARPYTAPNILPFSARSVPVGAAVKPMAIKKQSVPVRPALVNDSAGAAQ